VTEQELEDWMKYVQTRYVRMDTDRQWSEHNPDNTATLSWASYKLRVYAFVEGLLTQLFTVLITTRSELCKVLFLALSVTFLFVYEIPQEPLNKFVLNSYGRHV